MQFNNLFVYLSRHPSCHPTKCVKTLKMSPMYEHIHANIQLNIKTPTSNSNVQ